VELKELVEKLREGNAWQFANDRVMRGFQGGKRVEVGSKIVASVGGLPGGVLKLPLDSLDDKSKADDSTILKAASTCIGCGMSLGSDEIEAAVAKATTMRGFLRIVRKKIEHKEECSLA
jgi:hypothetical protein